MELRTRRLLLRRPTRAEAEALVRGEHPGTLACAAEYPHADTADALRGFAGGDVGASPPWLIIRLADELAIGEIGFGGEIEPGVRTGGYGLTESAWGQGFATEALVAVLAATFAEAGVSRVVAEALKSNVGSWRVMEKAGMRRIAEFEQDEGEIHATFVRYEATGPSPAGSA